MNRKKKTLNKSLILASILACLLSLAFYEKKKANADSNVVTKQIFFEKEIYKKPALEALTHYPELAKTKIEFVDGGKSKIAHQAIIKISTIFKRNSKKIFLVKIASDQFGELDSTLFKNLEYESQVGVLGHELAHILDYSDESSFQLISKGVKYLASKKFRINYELNTNIEAIKHGLGNEILSWSKEVHHYFKDDGRANLYHSPKEIKMILDTLSMNR